MVTFIAFPSYAADRGRGPAFTVMATLGTLLAVLVGLIATASHAHAESLRCNGQALSEGDSRVHVLYACGEPLLRDSYCAPLMQGPVYQPVPLAQAQALGLACQVVDEWLYDRGPGNLMATVRFRDGVVQTVIYGKVRRTNK